MTDQELLEKAKQALDITVPVLAYRVTGKTVQMWLYGGDGKPVEFRNGIAPDDFTVIKGIGHVAQRNLVEVGITTWAKLRKTNMTGLSAIVGTAAAQAIKDYLYPAPTEPAAPE